MAAREAAGLDALTPALAAEVGDRLGRECTVILPATPSHRHFAGGASVLRREGEERIVLFTGRVVPTSLPDFVCAIRAVARLRERGIPARLVQTGAIDAGLDLRTLARAEGLDIDGLSLVGHIPFTNVLPTLRDADVLIQPGPPTRFNRLRLPSKLQLYLEAARPTITFSAGVGELLSEGDEVLMTHGDDPAELADLLWRVLTDGALHAKLSAGSLKASARLFDNSRNTDALLMYYRRSLGRIARERETEHRIPT
jgi:glycosyltransferase involved in cell wall biosynthesis